MKPRRTVRSTGVLRLEGGNEDNDLWFESTATDDGQHVFETVWEPTEEERAVISSGQGNVYLLVWGDGHPPVAMGVTGIPLGKAK
jgi:hypothetical protein